MNCEGEKDCNQCFKVAPPAFLDPCCKANGNSGKIDRETVALPLGYPIVKNVCM